MGRGEVLCEGCVWARGRYCVKCVCGVGGGVGPFICTMLMDLYPKC